MRFLDERPGAIAVAVATLLALATAPATADPAAEPLGPACADYTAGSSSSAKLASTPAEFWAVRRSMPGAGYARPTLAAVDRRSS